MEQKTARYSVGLDVGSTTAKIVAWDNTTGKIAYDDYRRHKAGIEQCVATLFEGLARAIGGEPFSISITGSVGMGVAEALAVPFVQEVVAACEVVKHRGAEASTVIDIGGEDAKIIFLDHGKVSDLRMNGNCAGGTGAFIDQMAVLLDVRPEDMNTLAEKSTQIYPIASRCGVFCKTDIQNLIARNVSKEDIAASVFRAVAVQTIVTLAHGHDITPPIMMCGGPLTFIPSLRKAFVNFLQIQESDILLPDRPELVPALGAALLAHGDSMTVSDLLSALRQATDKVEANAGDCLAPLFKDTAHYAQWRASLPGRHIGKAELRPGVNEVTLGIDSGSTTTKVVALNQHRQVVFSYYSDNDGSPINAASRGLALLKQRCSEIGATLWIKGSAATGYGEDLIKTAFDFDSGIVETMAHFTAAHYVNPDVSFILDIGGQDMKAIFVDHGAINRIEVNEACSSGCGSFISTFARSLNQSAEEFAQAACMATAPRDLGTRCTVFMNSKVKQVLRQGASIPDIAAGLSYSVVRNCLYKVLKIKDISELGETIVLQGGTMKNDSIVRCFQLLTGATVNRSDMPELMGAIGCALYACDHAARSAVRASSETQLVPSPYATTQLHCKGCENQCAVTRYSFANGNHYYSGNRCEKVFNHQGKNAYKGHNTYEDKLQLLFGRTAEHHADALTIGLPRALNTYEEYPFWHTLLTRCGLNTCLSDESHFAQYEHSACKVMTDNICFPAKLTHSHIDNLIGKGVDRILMPFVVHEMSEKGEQNSYNCPVVSGYSQVIHSVHQSSIPIDSPVISFKDEGSLQRQCVDYLATLGIDRKRAIRAFRSALAAQHEFSRRLAEINRQVLQEARQLGHRVIVLAGRPYHTDPLIQHKVSQMVAAMGIDVITDDIVRGTPIDLHTANYLSQWSFTNRIVKAARWVAAQDDQVQMVELTSFGCGPDAFLIGEIRRILHDAGKALTLLKIDDMNNIGSLKLRVRSLIESLRLNPHHHGGDSQPIHLPPYTKSERRRKIIVPFFTPTISPLLPAIMQVAGYDVESLPMSDEQSVEWGLRSANNEVCYPATLIIGDIIKALRSGKYDPDRTCVAMTQTGGQCRASNYLPLLRKALMDHGFTNTPVISISFLSGLQNEQPGFKINWPKILPLALMTILYADAMAKFYYSTVCRESQAGSARRLLGHYLSEGRNAILTQRPDNLLTLLRQAAADFDAACTDAQCPQVGVVGEIFLKYHPFAQKNLIRWLVEHGIEVVPPDLIDFFMQAFVNEKENRRTHVEHTNIPEWIYTLIFRRTQNTIERVNQACRGFRWFKPFGNTFDKARRAEKLITLSAQFGEGWLIPAEMATLAAQGVTHVVSLQPFGCIANHIVEKGIENKIKAAYPNLNILSLDFDSSVSEVNIINRLLLFLDNLGAEDETNKAMQ